MSSEFAVKVEHLSKCYHIYEKPRDRLLQMIAGRRRQFYREFWALRDVSFAMVKGETVGIVGRNGAGKSTLLQLICGTLNQTSGTITTRGRIAALLELGSGFNPDFTGRENVYLNGALLGMAKSEIDARYQEIVGFAGIGDFIEQPVKVYSSGMFARLAFSVAVHVQPSLLIVDEVLSVGDLAFQEKSYTRMKALKESGTSILFVSHSLSAVRNFCDRAIWIDAGRVRAVGDRLTVCDEYQRAVEEDMRREAPGTPVSHRNASGDNPSRRADSTLDIVGVTSDRDTYRMGDDIQISISLRFNRVPDAYGVGIIIYDSRGNIVTILNTLRDELVLCEERSSWTLVIRNNHFAPGEYSVTVSIPDENAMFSYAKWEYCLRFRIEMERTARGLATVDGVMRCDHEWR